MKKLQKIFYRGAVLSLAVSVFLLCFSFPVGAESIDYNDYITNITVDGNNDICTVEIPFTGTWQIVDVDGSGNTVPGTDVILSGNDVKHTLYPGYRYSIGVCPMGNPKSLWSVAVGSYVSPDAIDLTDLPAGATLQVFVNVGVGNGSVTVKDSSTFLYYVSEKADGFYLAKDKSKYTNTYSVNNGLNVHVTSPVITLENGYDAFSYGIWLGTVNVGYAGSTNLACKTVLTFSISSAYREYVESGKNAKLMKAIEQKLEENGQKLDDMMTYEPQPDTPAGADKFDELEEIEDQLRDDTQSGLDAILDLNNIANEGITPYISALFAVGTIFSLFADLPFFRVLLYISLALGTTGSLLAIADLAIGRNIAKNMRNQKSKSNNKKKGGG